MCSFISNSNFVVNGAFVFPYSDILGINVYSVNCSSFIYLRELSVVKKPLYKDYKILLTFYDIDDKPVFSSTTATFEYYLNEDNNQTDYRLDFYTINEHRYCGCMVVKPLFMTWLIHTITEFLEIPVGNIQINPNYIHNNGAEALNKVRVNGKIVQLINFINAYVRKNEGIWIINKEVYKEPDIPDKMTALRIYSASGDFILKGESIGFTITPPATGKYCRVHIVTEPDNITFIDQSTNL